MKSLHISPSTAYSGCKPSTFMSSLQPQTSESKNAVGFCSVASIYNLRASTRHIHAFFPILHVSAHTPPLHPPHFSIAIGYILIFKKCLIRYYKAVLGISLYLNMLKKLDMVIWFFLIICEQASRLR